MICAASLSHPASPWRTMRSLGPHSRDEELPQRGQGIALLCKLFILLHSKIMQTETIPSRGLTQGEGGRWQDSLLQPHQPHPAPHRKCKPSSVKISTCRDRNSSSSCELCSSPGAVTPNISTWDRAGAPGQEVLGGGGDLCMASWVCATHFSEVMNSVQSPGLLPGVCLGPVAGAGTNHPSRSM